VPIGSKFLLSFFFLAILKNTFFLLSFQWTDVKDSSTDDLGKRNRFQQQKKRKQEQSDSKKKAGFLVVMVEVDGEAESAAKSKGEAFDGAVVVLDVEAGSRQRDLTVMI
jgi:hypothetical protein